MSKSNHKTAKDVPVPKLPKVDFSGLYDKSKIDFSGFHDIRDINDSEDKPKKLTAIKNTIIFQIGVFLTLGLTKHFFEFPEELDALFFTSGIVLVVFFCLSLLAFTPITELIKKKTKICLYIVDFIVLFFIICPLNIMFLKIFGIVLGIALAVFLLYKLLTWDVDESVDRARKKKVYVLEKD